MMPRAKFEAMVEEVLASLPRRFRRRLQNVAIMVEDWPPKNEPGRLVLGIYHGVPFPHRGPFYGNVSPDVIVIYQGAVEAIAKNEEEIREKVREVIFHEIGHYFGMSESDLARQERKNDGKERG